MLLIYGFGGFGKMLASIIFEQNNSIQIGIFDDKIPDNLPSYVKYLGSYNSEIFMNAELLIAFGDNEIREKVSKQINHKFHTLIHPTAYISSNVAIGPGSIILQNAVIQNNSVINKHCIIQPNVVIDHDVIVNDYTHIYSNSYIGSNSFINSQTLIEPNTNVKRFSKL